MTEARIVLVILGVLAVVLVGLPIMTVLTATKLVPDEQAETADISKFFRAAEQPGTTARPVKGTSAVLPPGLAQDEAYQKLHAAGFRCEPDAGSAACFRSTKTSAMCPVEWRVRMTFDETGHITASDGLSTATCPS